MKYGHSTGTKTEKAGSQDWYSAIAEQHIARIEAEQTAKDDAARTLTTALATQVGHAVTALPEAASRITKAATLVQSHSVWPLTSGNFLVGSQSDTQAAHLVTRGPWRCDCPDHTHRQHLCKHILSAMLTVKLGRTYEPSYN